MQDVDVNRLRVFRAVVASGTVVRPADLFDFDAIERILSGG